MAAARPDCKVGRPQTVVVGGHHGSPDLEWGWFPDEKLKCISVPFIL